MQGIARGIKSPASRPTSERACLKFVGAAWRLAPTANARGTTAMIGMTSRHRNHSSPMSIGCQPVADASARLVEAKPTMPTNGSATRITHPRCCSRPRRPDQELRPECLCALQLAIASTITAASSRSPSLAGGWKRPESPPPPFSCAEPASRAFTAKSLRG